MGSIEGSIRGAKELALEQSLHTARAVRLAGATGNPLLLVAQLHPGKLGLQRSGLHGQLAGGGVSSCLGQVTASEATAEGPALALVGAAVLRDGRCKGRKQRVRGM